MANTIKVNGNVISYTTVQKVETTVTFSDGNTAVLIGSAANAAVLKAYKALPASPPVIIVKPSPGEPRMISWKDFRGLSDIEGESFKIKAASVTEDAWLKNFNRVSIDLSDVQFSVNGYAIQLNGHCNDLSFKGGLFKGGGGCFVYKFGTFYNGSPETMVKNIVIDGVTSDNHGVIWQSDGGLTVGKGFHDVIQGFTIKNCVAKNLPTVGNVVYLGAAEDYLIQNNEVDNVNTAINNHNGVFSIQGNGRIIGNRVTNHQGNAFRLQPIQVLSKDKTIEIYNNVVVGSRRYSAIEVQVPVDYIDSPLFKPADISIHNNTVGRLEQEKEWQGVLVDVYATRSKIDITNNIGFELYKSANHVSQPIDDMVNIASGDALTVVAQSGNKYFPTAAQAVADTINFKSLYTGIGA